MAQMIHLHARSRGLGILGVGASKEEAIAAYDAAANELQLVLKKNLEEFPKSAAALNLWPKVVAEEKQFWADRQDTYASTKGITFWGDRVQKANEYKARWTELAQLVAAKVEDLQETAKTPGYDPYAGKKPKGSEGLPGWAIGGIAAVVVLGAGYFYMRRSGKLSGLRRKRRSR